jgi:hypothetical protein
MVNLASKHKQSFDLIGLKHNHDTDRMKRASVKQRVFLIKF